MRKTFYTLTSRVPARRARLEGLGWVYVSSELAPDRPAPPGETMTALVMTKAL